jgi:hypothetical protein
MSFDPKKIDRLAAKATLLEEQVGALVAELEELAEAARAEAAAAPPQAPVAAPAAAAAPPQVPVAPSAPEGPIAPPAAAFEPAMPVASVPDPEPEPGPKPPAASRPKAGSGIPEGPRLVALNMALRGTPRDQTARYLRENYDVEDLDELLDDVYARAGS